MATLKTFSHEFVEFIPEHLEPGKVYVCIPFATVAHLCACGCGHEVVTPLTPTDWKLTFDGETVSLHPSIGNWSFECQSHYWVRGNSVQWADQSTKVEVDAGRARDRIAKQVQFRTTRQEASPPNQNQKTLRWLCNAIRRFWAKKS